jgi:hypothetical protein
MAVWLSALSTGSALPSQEDFWYSILFEAKSTLLPSENGTIRYITKQQKRTPWPWSAREICRQSDRYLSAKLVPTFADRGYHVVSVTDPYGRILGFLDRSCYFFFQVAPQLYSWGWVEPVPGPLLLRKSGSAGNGTRTSEFVAKNSDQLDHRGAQLSST